jgi:hypothetical protein
MPENFLQLDEPIKIQLCGVELVMQYPLRTLRRLAQQLGAPTIGRRSILTDLDESKLPEVILAGICDPKTGEAPNGADGKPITIDDIIDLPSSSLAYLATKFTQAYTQCIEPEKKLDPALTIPVPQLKSPI